MASKAMKETNNIYILVPPQDLRAIARATYSSCLYGTVVHRFNFFRLGNMLQI